jgi:Carboxypeptidase regulatory-like domain
MNKIGIYALVSGLILLRSRNGGTQMRHYGENGGHRVMISRVLLLGLVFALVAPRAARAIELYGSIRGTVKDVTGAVVPGATIKATNVATGISWTVTSTSDGSYQFLQLPAPASYDVTAQKSGFKLFTATAVHLNLTQIYVLDVTLQVGAVTEHVTVEAAPAQVERTSMQLGATLTATQVTNLPLNGRNWVNLQQTLPGVVAAADGRGNFATNGSEVDQNSYLINGIDTNDLPLNTPLVIPSPDAIGEVRLVTSTINPEYGRNSGAILNATIKAGTNQFHGDGFEFYRDTSLDARNFFKAKPDIFHQNQYGGTVGGPIWRQHTFFFFSYQGTRNSVPQSGGVVTVFTPDQRNGFFPGVASSTTASPFPLVGEDGNTYPQGTPYNVIFPTGHIPSADFNPLSVSLLNKFVPPPTSGTEYRFSPTLAGKTDQYITRIDHNLGSKDTIWGAWAWQSHPLNYTLPFTGATLPGFPMTSQSHIQTYSLTWNHTFNSTTLNEARIGYTRLNYLAVQPVDVLDPNSVGFTGINVQDPTLSSWPRIDVTGFFRLGFSSNGPQPRIDQTYQVDDNFSKIIGRHTFKMGFDMRRFQVYNPFSFRLNGQFSFSTSGTYSTGEPGANFLLGIPSSYAQGGKDIINSRSQEYYAYFQDQWKIRPNLTLTYGTGWSVDTPLIDNYHSNHAGIAFQPGQTSTVFPNSPTGYVFQGDPGVNAFGTTKYDHFGPRIGFAWSPGSSGKWSVRGGYGIYFNRTLEEQTLQFLGSPPFSLTSGGVGDVGLSPSFAEPFVDIAGRGSIPNKFPLPSNPPSSVDFSPFVPMAVEVVDPNISVPYSQNFNLTIQRQLSANTIVSLAYVGALGRKLILTRELNPLVNQAGCLADPNCVDAVPFQNSATPQYYRYPGDVFGSIYNDQSTGISNYNSFQATANKHVSHGLEFFATYTWSHALDDGSGFENSTFGGGGFGAYGNTRLTDPFSQTLRDYGASQYDARHRFVISYVYTFPSVQRVNNWALKRVLDGWRMAGATTFQTGFPLDVVDTSFLSLTCDAYSFEGVCPDIPNNIAPPQYYDPRTSSVVNSTQGGTTANNHYWFNPNTFSVEALGTFGNAGRNPLRGPRIANFDWALFKDVAITERTRIELRFEFYNLFNHTQFDPAGVTTDIADGNFGRILNARDPRLIQLAAKFYF